MARAIYNNHMCGGDCGEGGCECVEWGSREAALFAIWYIVEL